MVESSWSHVPLQLLMYSVKFLLPRDNIPSGNENLESLAKPYFPTVWFTTLAKAAVVADMSQSGVFEWCLTSPYY